MGNHAARSTPFMSCVLACHACNTHDTQPSPSSAHRYKAWQSLPWQMSIRKRCVMRAWPERGLARDGESREQESGWLPETLQWSRRQYFFINSLRRRAGNKFCAVNLSHDFSWPITTIRQEQRGRCRSDNNGSKLTGLRYTQSVCGEREWAERG